jgi:hypothetical protein
MQKDIGNYIVYSDGRVWSKRKIKFMNPSINKPGYFITKINGKAKRIHRIVAETFIPNPLNLPAVHHINNNKLDNNVENLEWTTSEENTKKAYYDKIILPRKGILHGKSKLTEEQAKKIKYEHKDLTNIQIEKLYNISKSLVCNIKAGRTWKHV